MSCIEKFMDNKGQVTYKDCNNAATQPPPLSGPGTELKKLLKIIGITASPNCSCNFRAMQMDRWGPQGCEEKINDIVGWLREEANKRGLPFIDYAGKILIKKAIRNASRNATNK